MMNVWTKFRGTLRDFRFARGGNVAITFALATIPAIGAIGAGFDFSHANSVKADMQAALDSTALMLSRDAATLSNSDLQTKALAYFTALFNRPNEASIGAVSATYTASGGSQVVVNGTVTVPTTFLRVLGPSSMQNITVTGSSTTKWGTTRLRVALVLDNTGSMADAGKMTALKSATQSLLTQLRSAASTNGDVYVSIIPFVKDVNLGAANYNSSWIDWTDWNANNQTCSGGGWGWGWGGGWGGGSCTPNNHNTWNGCVVDRGDANSPNSSNYDTNVVSPTTSITATLYSAEQYSSCPQAAMGLSYDWTGMSTLVNNMSPAGNTNQAIGLQVGWMSLAGGGPFSVPAMDPNYTYQEAIILLTDGLNTQDRWYSNQSSIDARQQITCDNIKAAGVTLYTIQVNTGGDPTSTLLQNCASTSDKFFLLTSASGIATVFNQIGTNLTKLRVAR
jgi:Flp pilus assembly protein TadG